MMTSLGKNMWAEISADIPRGGSTERRNEKVPCYSLTKTECLYVATKFNDEVGAQKFTFSHSHFHILCAAPMIFGGVSANEASFFADAGLQEKQECVDGTCRWRRQKGRPDSGPPWRTLLASSRIEAKGLGMTV